MIEWINAISLLVSSLLFTYFYIISVQPAALEKKLGHNAFARCGKYRSMAVVFETVILINYFLYYFFPLPSPLPQYFPWDYWISLALFLVFFIPSIALMGIGIKDAGMETVKPLKESTLFGGIYEKMRHPQAFGASIMWLSIPLFFNSPFLFVISIFWPIVFYLVCIFEERDLIIRYGDQYIEYRRRVGILPKRGS